MLFPDFLVPPPREPACLTPCGERYYPPLSALDSPDPCTGLAAEEARFVAAVAHVFPDACERLAGVNVSVREFDPESDGGWYVDQWGRKVAGLMGCGVGPFGNGFAQDVIELANDDWFTNAAAHEQLHMLECPTENVDHVGWRDAGYYDVIERVQTRPKDEPAVNP